MTSTSSSKDAGSATLAALMLAASWWLPNHHWPWADFYSDAWASLTLFCVAVAVLWKFRGGRRLDWHLLPLMAMACGVVVGLQYAVGLIEAPGVAWISALYLLAFTLALQTGAEWEKGESGRCAHFLFLAFLVGAFGSLLVQFQQWLRLDVGNAFWLFLPAPPRRFHANLGQPNQLASLMCLGVLACAWFHGRKQLPGLVAWILAAMLAIGLALTESRTSWAVVAFSLFTLVVLRRRVGINPTLIAGAFGWVAFFGLCVFALPHVNVWLGQTLERQEVRGLAGEMRLDIWRSVWEALMQRPWFGYGWMQTSMTQFPENPYLVATGGSLRHAHNLFLDLLVFLGIPLGLTVCVALVAWFGKAFKSIQRPSSLWMLLSVAALGIHAMLEFPLYYAYFLLPLGLMLGAINVELGFRTYLRTARWPVAGMLTAAGFGWYLTAHDYLPIEENFFSLRFEHQKLAKPDEDSLPSPVVLTHLQDLLWLGRVDPAKAHSESDVRRALRISKSMPSVVGQYKLAVMYALTDQPEAAEYWLVAMLRGNEVKPRLALELRRQWEEQATDYPSMKRVKWPDRLFEG